MKPRWLLAVVTLGALATSGCEPVTPDFAKNTADVLLRVTQVLAEGVDGDESAFLISDVWFDEDVLDDIPGSVVNDNAVVTVQLLAKNPNLTEPGNFNDVQLTDYRVRYLRSDGQNIEGLDVPYQITGKLSTLIEVNADADIAFILVRHQAKQEPPLRNLIDGGQEDIITMIGEITLYGRTTSGRAVSTVGYIDIVFGNFAND